MRDRSIMAGEGGSIPAAAEGALTPPAPAATLERARVLIETIRAASEELAAISGTLWHESRSRTWPSLEDFRRMTPADVNAFLESIGAIVRVVDPGTPQHKP
jgi:hypothetical protein